MKNLRVYFVKNFIKLETCAGNQKLPVDDRWTLARSKNHVTVAFEQNMPFEMFASRTWNKCV